MIGPIERDKQKVHPIKSFAKEFRKRSSLRVSLYSLSYNTGVSVLTLLVFSFHARAAGHFSAKELSFYRET